MYLCVVKDNNIPCQGKIELLRLIRFKGFYFHRRASLVEEIFDG